jgi:hypothetical protein
LPEESLDLIGGPDLLLKAQLPLMSDSSERSERVALLESLGLCADGIEETDQ